jgi:ligand-binding sensor domain-containing protein/putative methionine-R-sulfoxide reductase with GAF domain/anti-sigma regulatory factor (Ser/Thr protein kinase)
MRLSITIFVQCICLLCQAQNNTYHFTNYTTARGLSNNNINVIAKDSRNFIWLGTAEGLNRFDGTGFVSYLSDQNNKATLSGNNVFDILQYQPGYLLIATNNGLSVFNTFTGEFENDKIFMPALQKGSGTIVRSLFKDKKNRIFINHSGVIDVFNDTLGFLYRFTDFPWAYALRGSVLNREQWYQDSQNRIWLATDNKGICIIDESKQQVYSGYNNPMKYPFISLSRTAVRSFFYDEQNQVVWYSIWGYGLEKYDLKKKECREQLFNIAVGNEARCINSITLAKDGNLICGGGQAIYSVDRETLQYKIINTDFNTNSLPALLGSTIFNDSTYIWIGTETKGLIKLAANKWYVQQVPLPYPVNDYTNYSTGILRSENKLIYLGYGLDGLLEVDPETHLMRKYKFRTKENVPLGVNRICEDKEGRFWIGTGKGLYLFDKKNKKIVQPDWMPASIKNLDVSFLFCDKKGKIWISFRRPNSLGIYDVSENIFEYFENYKVDSFTIFDKKLLISRITEDINENIWLVSYEGVDITSFEPKSGKWKSYPANKKKSTLPFNNGILSICPGAKNEIWTSNEFGPGLKNYNYSTDSIFFISRKDGLISDNIFCITKGVGDNLFLVSMAGINLFNPGTKEIRTLRLPDENINLSFALQQFYDSVNHQLVYGLNDRLLFIDDRIWETTSNNQIVFIDNITINNKPRHIDSLTKQHMLNYFEKDITISFASVNYSENSSISYAYKMDGANLNNDWTITSQVPVANYTNLSPGKYVFLVKAKTQTGVWGPVNNSLELIIAPPFWKTWWFISIIAFSILLLSFLFIRGREKSFKAVAAAKLKVQQLNAEKYKNKLELEQIINYFSSSLIDKNKVDDVLWDVAKNLIGRLGFADCMIYLWNDDKTKMIQKAGFGPKGSVEEINKQHFDVLPDQGVVGYVIQTKEPVLIGDTSKDNRYRPDEMVRLSEMCVPIIYNNELLGIIDSEYPERNFYTQQHLQLLTTIATLIANKIKSLEAEQSLRQSDIEMYSMNEQLSKAKLEALQSQMNPHFIFNSLNAIDNLIQTNQKDKATTYLARFAKLIRNVLDSSKNDTVSFQKDYETLKLYLQMEQFRSNDKFTYELVAEDELLHSDYKVLPLIVQPFVENAIHHGLLNKLNEERKLTVSAIVENDYIKYTVIDNGVGRAKAQELNELNKPGHQSYGIDITKERIQLYNQTGDNNNVTITDLFENDEPAGTKVEIRVKNLETT